MTSDARGAVAVAVDLGGASVRAAPASRFAGGRSGVEPVRASVTQDMDRGTLVDVIAGVVNVAADGPVGHVVVAIPSFVVTDSSFGPCPQLPALPGAHLDQLLAAATAADSVKLVPDVTAAAVGEQRLGVGRQSARFMCVALGTGANAAAVFDGRPVDTAWGCLGDAGHVLVDPSGPPCPCGGRGCLETMCSAVALARDGAAFGWHGARAVLEAAAAGNAEARGLVAGAGVALGRAIATWSVMLWPDTVAVAGGLSAAGEALIAPAVAEMRRVGPPYVVGGLDVIVAQLGSQAALAGAALLALER